MLDLIVCSLHSILG